MMPVLIILAVILIAATLMEFLPFSFWWIRVFDFPHFQVWWLSLFTLAAGLIFFDDFSLFEFIIFGGLTLCLFYKSARIFPYTFFAPKQALAASHVTDETSFSMLVANVLMNNRNTAGIIREIKRFNPDIVLLLEPDQWWEDELSEVEKEYTNKVSVPLDNLYGMILYSRLRIVHHMVRYVTLGDIPSIECRVELRCGKQFNLYCIHPLPPAPKQDTDERDAELMLFAEKVKEESIPVVVAGDLNDVAWSYTTKLFLKESGMLDPRLGRGYFNTFNARIPFLRYPLDHVFHTRDFRLIKMARGKQFGSDHFPIYISLNLEPENGSRQEPPENPDKEERKDIDKMKRQQRKL